MGAAGLSKSQYIMGKQCPKALWLYRHPQALAQSFNQAASKGGNAATAIGNEIGELAKTVFAGGVEVTDHYADLAGAEATTKALIAAGTDVIYEATAINPADGSHAKLDILKRIPGTDEWEMIEVKASTGVKDYHLDDMAFQYHVFTSAGYNIRRAALMHVNRTYTRSGDLDPKALFKQADVTAKIRARQPALAAEIAQLNEAAAQKQAPEAEIGGRCSAPLDCRYKFNCWTGVPKFSVFNLYSRDSGEAEAIARQTGSFAVQDIPAALLPDKAERQIELAAQRDNRDYADTAALQAFLGRLQYPLYFLDYETINPGAPAYDGTRPYQQVPFQFSLHVQKTPRGKLVQDGFLHREATDPREAFIKKLIAVCGDRGSVIVYNQEFEEKRNIELAKAFPAYAPALEAINKRMVDLYLPFKHRWMYHPAQNGSASIKAVLPAYTSLSYSTLAIGNGADASQLYQNFVKGRMDAAEQAKLWPALEEYCGMDTYAMVELLKVVREKAKPVPSAAPSTAPGPRP